MPFAPGKSGNPKGFTHRTPSNKQIKNAIKNCSMEAIDNIASYMRDCRELIDQLYKEIEGIELTVKTIEDKEQKEKLLAQSARQRMQIYSYYEALAKVSKTLLDYTHDLVITEDKAEKGKPEEPSKPARVSLKAVSLKEAS